METLIRAADWNGDREQIRAVREAVFILEQNVDPAIEWDDQEETAQHFLALQGGEPVATGRITRTGKIGRMAVVKSQRGSGLGFRLLEFICEHARQNAHQSVYLHAQCHAEGFYRKAGFTAEGEEFTEAGIPHIKMVRRFD
ncbi:GNAT family N-acetyltransferase [Microbulbifer taiwanensis]|uniref:GNAT family N-acetyltransferase n=1 Tax=Microbulbifer taiwanensis TaxID=986746 RepID=A0ABW1YJL4_9GAMM|nr:GNAT family N-acetyltransferase [Microbulbifer taiwanensis]